MSQAGLPERFWAKVEPEPNSGCWLWVAALDEEGYARFHFMGTNRNAYKLAFEVLRAPVPPGLFLDHLCRVRCCVNPWHLEPVSKRENAIRGDSRPAVNLRKAHCPRGHPYSPENTTFGRNRNHRLCRMCRQEWEAMHPGRREKYRRGIPNAV